MTGIAFTGGGRMDSELSTEQRETAMFVSIYISVRIKSQL